MQKLGNVFTENKLREMLGELVVRINKNSVFTFELNETKGYFSIQVVGREKNKNVVRFVKDEPVLSINVYTNISKSTFENPPYDVFIKRKFPPKGLQLREFDLIKYPKLRI